MKNSDQATNTPENINLVTGKAKAYLNERQLIDYSTEREQFLDRLLHFGKDPEKTEGYAKTTVKSRANRMDQFYRWVWEEEGRYTPSLTHEHADEYLRHHSYSDKRINRKPTAT
ncbi:hypothetical protein [Halobellus sp. EA9]|uniref:hypothetical protein n=1 Tax=Halobellus sp. EA9 TaxID=3421647 RepID=UPI003EBABF6F